MSETHKGPDYRSAALRNNWAELTPIFEELNKVDKVIDDAFEGDSYFDFDAWERDEYPTLRAQRSELIQRLERKIARYERPECLQLGRAVTERLAPELRQTIYEELCSSRKPVLIPDRKFEFFSKIPTGMEILARCDGDGVEDEDTDAEDEQLQRETKAKRTKFWFDPTWFGPEFASEITKAYFEKNVFHFRDVRRELPSFFATRFPCGTLPGDVIRSLRVYIRCENFLEWAGFNPSYDPEEGDNEEPDSDFEWQEHGVYDFIRNPAQCLTRINFRAKPNITLVIVTPFDRWGATKLESDRIMLNFEEAIMEAYHALKRKGATVQVVEKGYDDACEKEWLPRPELFDSPITWHFDLAEESYLERSRRGQYPQYLYPDARRPRHREGLERRIEELQEQKGHEAEAELERRIAAYKASVPETQWGWLNLYRL